MNGKKRKDSYLRIRLDPMLNDPRRKKRAVYVFPVVVKFGVGEVGAFAEEAEDADCFFRICVLGVCLGW